MSNPEYKHKLDVGYFRSEWARRATEWAMRMDEGNKEQIQINEVGNVLRTARLNQGVWLVEIAQRASIEPELLSFIESGWTTPEELLGVIDSWAEVLGENPEQLRSRLTSSE